MIHHPAHHPGRRRQSGFTLIEVLVTLVLVSVGLLGIAALQLTTLQGNQESYVRSQASVLAGDMLDRIRANPVAFRNGDYTFDYNGQPADTTTRVGYDVSKWQTTIDTLLPGGAVAAAGKIELTPPAGTGRYIVTITIRWNERPPKDFRDAVNDNGDRLFMTRSEI
jgi:type IV pilus assembly protein PilV